ncbi:casein kinase II [Polychytrium aggregatum]|uniref:casein kinase II n=1 Tax=Polychytrium aggregatum TaxID=110093 RepID=UPI0022FED925|nr:casein kinase II [Polychytrium aggregatum]KAI9209479.1 casein kinase II [Polychytrium aggregatum]
MRLPKGSVARAYPRALLGQPRSVTDWERSQVAWVPSHRFSLGMEIGSGKFCNVYKAIDLEDPDREVAIKVFKAGKDVKVKREIFILRHLKGGPNIIDYIGAFQMPPGNESCLVFETLNETNWTEFARSLKDGEIQHYMYQLLLSLDYVHSRGVMHRDIKPQNLLLERQSRTLRLIDFGVSDFYLPGQKYSVHVGSRYLKGPELLLGFRRYDYSLDMWAYGLTLAALVFGKHFMFVGSDDPDQLRVLHEFLGTADLKAYVKRYEMESHLNPEAYDMIVNCPVTYPKRPWSSFINETNEQWATDLALDLIDRLVRYDHAERLTAQEAMVHPFFNGYR